MRRSPRSHQPIHRFPFRIALLLACMVGFALPGRAQTGVYAMFSASDFQTPNVSRQYGPTFGVYHDMWSLPVVHAGVDLRATLLGSGSTKAYTGMIGPKLQLHPHVLPLMPYVEGLVGAGDVQVGEGVAVIDKTAIAYEGVAGVDWTILPRIDWRVVEFAAGGFSSLNASVSPRTLSTGLVVRLP
ncbi:MAG TPA: hypothetical protein VGT04_10135 [Acidobacteriaceae bacterium]|nr:hypothetical protein [Acidobacteriaceae bacterium]